MPTTRLKNEIAGILALIALAGLAATTTANAHLFTPATTSDKDYLESLYEKLGVIPPRYDLASRKLQDDEWGLFEEVLEHGSSQVGRYAIPLLGTALRWNTPPNNHTTEALAGALDHFINHHKRIAREHDSDVQRVRWLLSYHMQPPALKEAWLIKGFEGPESIRSSAIAMLTNGGDSNTQETLITAIKNTSSTTLKKRYTLASQRIHFQQTLAAQTPALRRQLLQQALSSFQRHGVHDMGLNRSDFEWLLSLASDNAAPNNEQLLKELSQSRQLTQSWRSIAKRYLALWQSRF